MSVVHHKELPVKLGSISIMEVTIIDNDGILNIITIINIKYIEIEVLNTYQLTIIILIFTSKFQNFIFF